MDHTNLIRTNISQIKAKILALNPSQKVQLIAVSKTKPVEYILNAYDTGHLIFGENKVQEARTKKPFLSDEIELHMIGPLQKNKIKYCPQLFTHIHSISDVETVSLLDKKCSEKGTQIKYFIQMNFSKEETKNGLINESQLCSFLDDVLDKNEVTPVGLMIIPPSTLSIIETGKIFSNLRRVRNSVKLKFGLSNFNELSMGMSNDYEIAIKEGATYIRVGQAIFGNRN